MNIVGSNALVRFPEIDIGEWNKIFEVNVVDTLRGIQTCAPLIKDSGGGSIVNVGSVAGEVAVMGVYSASKFGLRGLTDSVRREVRSYGIGVTLVEPGFVRTTMNEAMGDNLPDPSIVAEAIVAAVARPRRRHIVPAAYRAPILATQLLPRLTDLVFGDARIQRRINRDARAARKAALAAAHDAAR
jgi:NAD(P)-dependent dehydrogenase (short-subunit alcohol dehydrogenase family)